MFSVIFYLDGLLAHGEKAKGAIIIITIFLSDSLHFTHFFFMRKARFWNYSYKVNGWAEGLERIRGFPNFYLF